MRIAVNLIVTLLLFTGIVFLQIFLSRRESKWPGLVLPLIAFAFGLLYLLSMAVPQEGAATGFAGQFILVGLILNIPTFVFLAIYVGCREKNRRKKQLEKMSIQDLE